ncbi:hypothetical protein AB2M62_07950 [Sphingomonas sp. MMS12-HWE2-04]|uniref:hypothetical protein n=1 Tax=Sphingomonas sp. MMS12-HWE2-04 TaxID=3234199 RepID=UPI00384D8BA2
MRRAAFFAALLLTGCSGGKPAQPSGQPQDLESAAIERGMVRDPDDSSIEGLYARDTDRVCIVKAGSGYRIGAYVDYGDRITCSGSGTVTRGGEALHVELGGADCNFDAHFDGERIRFPGSVPAACAKLCARRAAFSGLDVARLSESAAEAAAMRDSSGKRLCGE